MTMKKWTRVLCWLAAGCVATVAVAQEWTVYTPPERDFRVVFPQPPTRTTDADGATVFRAAGDDMEYFVYRRDPTRQPLGNTGADIRRRLAGDADDDPVVQRIGEEDDDPATALHVFRRGGKISVHRIVAAPGRYYELVVRAPRGQLGDARRAARDFYGTFQAQDAGVAAGAAPGLAPDVLCKERTNVFSRVYCEYRACFQPGYENHPYCSTLIRR